MHPGSVCTHVTHPQPPHTTHASTHTMHTGSACTHVTHPQPPHSTHTMHTGSVCTHITHPHPPTQAHTLCTQALCVHMSHTHVSQMHHITHYTVNPHACTQQYKHANIQTCAHMLSEQFPLMKVDKQGPWSCSKCPQRRSSPHWRAPAGLQLPVPLVGVAILLTWCLPSAFHPHLKLWLVGSD